MEKETEWREDVKTFLAAGEAVITVFYDRSGKIRVENDSKQEIMIKVFRQPEPELDMDAAVISKAAVLREAPNCWREYIEKFFGSLDKMTVFHAQSKIRMLEDLDRQKAIRFLNKHGLIYYTETRDGCPPFLEPTGKSLT